MPEARPKIRLHVDGSLAAGAATPLSRAQSHYLGHVMRCRPGDGIALFNGRDGEWRATIRSFAKSGAEAKVEACLRPPADEPGPWLLFAPVKRAPLELTIEKATELGVERLQPVLTRRTVVGRLNAQRLAAIGIEAAEQCGRLTVPTLNPPCPLGDVVKAWPADRTLIFADEAGAPPLATVAAGIAGPQALLVGPEGGFEAEERAFLRGLGFVRPASLGPLILRAETAAIAGLAVLRALADSR